MSFFLQSKRNYDFWWKHPGFSPYKGLQWEPNGSRSKWQFQCSFKGL